MNNGNYIEEMDQAFEYEERMDEILDKAYNLVKEYFTEDFESENFRARVKELEKDGLLIIDFISSEGKTVMCLFVTTGLKCLQAWYFNEETNYKDTWLGTGEFKVEDAETSFSDLARNASIEDVVETLAAMVVSEVEDYLANI